MEQSLGLIIGTALAATCGFRIFVPLLGISIASMTGHLELAEGFGWKQRSDEPIPPVQSP